MSPEWHSVLLRGLENQAFSYSHALGLGCANGHRNPLESRPFVGGHSVGWALRDNRHLAGVSSE